MKFEVKYCSLNIRNFLLKTMSAASHSLLHRVPNGLNGNLEFEAIFRYRRREILSGFSANAPRLGSFFFTQHAVISLSCLPSFSCDYLKTGHNHPAVRLRDRPKQIRLCNADSSFSPREDSALSNQKPQMLRLSICPTVWLQ